MIAKGNQRGGGQQLATHLLNAHDNERIELAEVRGSIADDVHGAFAEWSAQAKATRCEKYLYSLSVNPDQRQGHLSREQYLDYLARVEKSLNLQGQARVVVFHHKVDKTGAAREHCHAVWSRIDIDKCRAVPIAHDRMKLRTVAREFAQHHGLELPPGLKNDRGKERYKAREAQADLQEKQQEERTGITKEQRRAAITKVWTATTNGEAFVKALQNQGYRLAQGDSRGYVIVDRAGEIHSLSRQLVGVKAAELKARLQQSHAPSSLPSVAEARTLVKKQREVLETFRAAAGQKEATPDERRATLAAQQATRRQALTDKQNAMSDRHRAEHGELLRIQTDERQGVAAARARPSGGVTAFLQRITGIRAITTRIQQRQDRKLDLEHRKQERSLQQRHRAERKEITRQDKNLIAIETRERRSMETRIKRDAFQKIARTLDEKQSLVEKFAERSRPAHPAASPARMSSREQLQAAFARAHGKPAIPEEKQASPLQKAWKQAAETSEGGRDSEKANEEANEALRPPKDQEYEP